LQQKTGKNFLGIAGEDVEEVEEVVVGLATK
jgi:hypothetical protein